MVYSISRNTFRSSVFMESIDGIINTAMFFLEKTYDEIIENLTSFDS